MTYTSRVGIYEPNYDGHRLKYVQYLIQHHLEVGGAQATLITSQEALASQDYKDHLGSLKPEFKTLIVKSNTFNDLVNSAKTANLDLLIVPDGDSIVWRKLWRTGWPLPGKIAALVMRPSGQSKQFAKRHIATAIKKILMLASRARKGVYVFELATSLKSKNLSSTEIPDPITYDPSEEQLDRVWPITDKDKTIKWIGIVGGLDARKNVPLFLRAILKLERTDFGIVLAGRMDKVTEEVSLPLLHNIRQRGIKVVVVNQFLSDGQLDAVIGRLHSVVLAHSNEGPSGILGKSTKSGTYIVAAGAKSLKKDCKHIGAQGFWTPLTDLGVCNSINTTLSLQPPAPLDLPSEKVFSERLMHPVKKGTGPC